jgi:hypothetical protein
VQLEGADDQDEVGGGDRWLLIRRSRRARTWRSAWRYAAVPVLLNTLTMWRQCGAANLA